MNMVDMLMALYAAALGVMGIGQIDTMSPHTFSNTIDTDRDLIILSAPSVHNEYYEDDFDSIVDFHIAYARTMLGNDNIVILVDRDTRPYYEELPEDVLLDADVDDIWIRDFSTVHPYRNIQFTYDPSYFESRDDAERIQESFVRMTEQFNVDYRWENWVLDGGNVVDNRKDKIVVSERFLEENDLSRTEAVDLLTEILDVKEVAIIPYDDEVMGHSDGMVMWADENTLLLNEYDEPFRSKVLDALHTSFSDIEIIEVPAQIDVTQWRSFNSSCGVNLNSVVTPNHIYVPTFGNKEADTKAIESIAKHTTKTVHTIPAEHVCHMGGSVRCMSWQLIGKNAEKLILAARKD